MGGQREIFASSHLVVLVRHEVVIAIWTLVEDGLGIRHNLGQRSHSRTGEGATEEQGHRDSAGTLPGNKTRAFLLKTEI